MVARRDRGVAGIVMSTRLPFTTPDYLHDKRFAHEPTLDDTFREEGIAALVGVPLIWEGEVIGLLFVADRYHRTHTAQSTSILCTLATYGAVALKNARDFERVNAALAKADQARAELERHLLGIQAATDAHEKITSLLARGASLATLVRVGRRSCSAAACSCSTRPASSSAAARRRLRRRAAAAYSANGAHRADLARAARASRATAAR
jgi:GAF domain-containing protein